MKEEQRKLSDFTIFDNQMENIRQSKEKKLKQLTPYKVIPIRLKGTNKTEKIDYTEKEQGGCKYQRGKGIV